MIAHEYGHHVQNLTGISAQVGPEWPRERLRAPGAPSGLLRGRVGGTGRGTGLIEDLTDDDIQEGLDAAGAVGDDRIQETATGRVDPESWTHGSAEQRQGWFTTGHDGGDPNDCDTFEAEDL